jgi:hypothetical protein
MVFKVKLMRNVLHRTKINGGFIFKAKYGLKWYAYYGQIKSKKFIQL